MSTWLIVLSGWTNVINFFRIALNSKHRTEKLKAKNQRYRNTKNQNTERRKPKLTERKGKRFKLISSRTEQINDHTWTIHKMQFRGSFKESITVKRVALYKKLYFFHEKSKKQEIGNNFMLLCQSRNVIGQIKKTFLHRPIKILQFITPARI